MRPVPEAIGLLPLRRFVAGEVLLQEGGEEPGLFFLERGTVEVWKDGQSIARVRERGAVFGEMSVLLGSAHTATVTAAGEVECRVAEAPAAYLAEHPEVVLYIGWILARRLDSLNRYLVDMRAQFEDREDHVGIANAVLGAIMNRHPRTIAPRADAGP